MRSTDSSLSSASSQAKQTTSGERSASSEGDTKKADISFANTAQFLLLSLESVAALTQV